MKLIGSDALDMYEWLNSYYGDSSRDAQKEEGPERDKEKGFWPRYLLKPCAEEEETAE